MFIIMHLVTVLLIYMIFYLFSVEIIEKQGTWTQ